MRNSQPENSQALRDRALRRDDPARARRAAARQRRAGNSTRFQRISGLGHAASSVRRLGAAVVLFVAAGVLGGGPAAARTSTSAADDFTLSTSVLSLTERDDPTEVTVTAVLSDPAADETMIKLDLGRSPLLTPGVRRGATNGRDYTAEFESSTITIAAGSTTGSTTLTVDPVYDNAVEGDEAIVVRGRTDAGRFIDATDLILEDGPYLSFPRHIVGSLNYPGQAIAVTVDEAADKARPSSTVTYSLTRTEPGDDPLGLTFDPETRQLTGTAPASADVPAGGLTTRYTVTARDSVGHVATTLVSVAVVHDVCSSTASGWFDSTEEPPAELIVDCNVLLAAKDALRGTASLNWATDTPIRAPWDGIIEFHDDTPWIRKIDLNLRGLDGTIPAVLGHLASPGSLDLVLGGDFRITDPSRENKLTGPIPPELGLLPRMVVLALSYNDLSGPIPRELAENRNLSQLYLHDTDVSGAIPAEFGNLPLRNLTISGNPGVTGHIPWQLGKNTSSNDHPGLQVLNLYSNNLEGRIPWQLGRFGKIQQFALSNNRLTGEIPPELGNLGNEEAELARRRVALFLNANQLTGTIPPELSGIVNMTVLSLGENRLTGTIPAELGGLSKLQSLSLRQNRLTGSIPTELGRLQALEGLSLACNALTGAVPASIGEIASLTELNVSGNPALDTDELPESLQRAGLRVQWPGTCAEFADVDPLSVHAADINALHTAGITTGCANNPLRYCPDDPVTRAQIASFLTRALKLPHTQGAATFADVDPLSVHAADINALHTAGITTGCANNPLRYCPDDPVTRAQIASFLTRALKLPDAQGASPVN